MSRAVKVAANAVIGGTAEELGGGKFANGAITGAFSMLFNDLMHQDPPEKEKTPEDLKAELKAKGVIFKEGLKEVYPEFDLIFIAKGLINLLSRTVTKSATNLTAHGTERIAGANATRGGVLSMEGVNTTKSLGRAFTQADGAKVFLHEVTPGRFNAVIQNQTTGKVITMMSNWSQKSINRIAKNYGWPIQ